MKKLIAVALILLIIFALAACSSKRMYNLEFDAYYDVINDVNSVYAAGDKVTIQLATVTEQYYVVYVNGTEIPRDNEASGLEYSYFTFTMPTEDVMVKIETKGAQMMPVYDDIRFTAGENGDIVSKDGGTQYVPVGYEHQVWCFGEWSFLGHVEGEKTSFTHLGSEIKTGMYSVNGKQDVLVRYFPDNEFAFIYVKKGLLKTQVSFENCIRFEFVRGQNDDEKALSNRGTTECAQFLDEIRSGPSAKEAGLYDLVIQPNGNYKNCYLYGYVYGVIQDDVNIAIPLQVMSFDDKAYSITIDDVEYVLPQEWLNRLVQDKAVSTAPLFNTQNVSRITIYGYYGKGDGIDVPADDMAEIVEWLGTFTLGERVGGEPIAPGTNTYHVELRYADGTVVKSGLDVIKLDGTSYYLDSDIPPNCFMDIIYQISY